MNYICSVLTTTQELRGRVQDARKVERQDAPNCAEACPRRVSSGEYSPYRIGFNSSHLMPLAALERNLRIRPETAGKPSKPEPIHSSCCF